ncbi:hypothetical protein L249_1340 [Ophiocordyceps polyrhachis-furcata BCC 54312]|uniref:t-SNARE coiled-coil homology domain-containing protein n=1 Tax=Ophiocordyceps polyrhachis-furcata BCC 54312 TaxID=1330021 RepID=A0A367LER2_9HYPO|nr:hypothetical protein L249_1340 [Ophiocordyceps polyrhachis-furcata BCC 54312]
MAQQYGYNARQNPFDQRDDAPAYGAPLRQPTGSYGQTSSYSRGFNKQDSMDAGYAGGNVEMASLAQNAGSFGGGDPNQILNECRDIDRGIDQVEKNLGSLRMLQKRTLDDADSSSSSAANRQLDALSSETMSLYRSLTDRIRTVKSNPESRTPKNNPQVGRVDRRLKAAIQQYQQVESEFRKRTQEQMARQYRIVRPDASESEIRAAVEDTNGGQVFSQALMQSDRQGRARAALNAVEDRHAALIKIEQQIVELSQLFQDMDTLVVQQDAAVLQIEQKGEEVIDNLDKGNEEIGVAVKTARKTRKKKWICLGVSILIIIIIVVVVLVYIFVVRGGPQNLVNNGGNNNNNANNANNPGKRDMDAITLPVAMIKRTISETPNFERLGRLVRRRLPFPPQAS